MRTEIAAKRYAQAAFAVALEQGELERWTATWSRWRPLSTQPEAAAVLRERSGADAEKEKAAHGRSAGRRSRWR